jgi:uncharacterized surface protein with fasciclin (FAS1) repeats
MSTPLKVAAAHAGDIIDAIENTDSLTNLMTAIKAAGLIDMLRGSGPFTLFAPSDAAFNKLPAGTMQRLIKPENAEELTSFLTYHIVAGKVMSNYVKGKKYSRKTVYGPEVMFDGMNGFTVNNAKVLTENILATNGLIHVIGTVLTPPQA